MKLLLEPTPLATWLLLVKSLRQSQLREFLSRLLVERKLAFQARNAFLDRANLRRVEIVESSVARRDGMHDADVDSNIERLHVGDLDFELNREDHEPVAAVLPDVNLLHDTGNEHPVRTLELDGTRSAVSNPADLRELDSPVGIVDVLRSKLRNPKAVTDVFRLELRPPFVCRIAIGTEAVADGAIEIAQGLLERLGHRLLKKGGLGLFFPEHQLVGELLVGEKLFTFRLALVLDPQRLVEDKPAATGVSVQGRTSGLVNVEFVLKGAGDLHMNIMAHFLQECVLYNQMPIWALYPPHEWRGFTAR